MAVKSKKPPLSYFHPRFWLVWIIYIFLRLIILLPYSLQMFLGRSLGRLLLVIFKKRKRIAETNIKICFPEWSHEKQNSLVKKHFESLGIFPFETAMACWWPDNKIRKIAYIEGIENLQKALEKKRGVIILAAHFITIVMACRILRLDFEFDITYRKLNNDLSDYLFASAGVAFNVEFIRHNDLRSIVRSFRKNRPVVYIPDRNFDRKNSEFIPFFGTLAATVTASSRLASINSSPVVPIVQQRLPDNGGFRLEIQEALEDYPGDDIKEDLLRVNQLVEQQVRDAPSEYLWIHRRFKTRPPGEKSLYK